MREAALAGKRIGWAPREEATASPAEAEAFAELYERYLPRVYAYLRYRLPCTQDAEDLTAATFERAISRLGSFRSNEAALGGWLLTIARSQVADFYRHWGRRGVALPLDEAPEPAEERPGVEERLLREEALARVQVHLQALPEREQEMIALKFGFGLTNRRIAELLAMNESTVGSALFNSLRRLRAWLKDEGYGD